MFKINGVIFLLVIIGALLTSCDGRYRRYRTNIEVLKEKGQLKTYSNREHFIPVQPIIIETDTIFQSGFHVKINYHSLEDQMVSLNSKSRDNINITRHYKNFQAELLVFKKELLLIEDIINPNFFCEFDSSNHLSKDAIMQHLWIDHAASTNETIQLNTSFFNPETRAYKDFVIIISEIGDIKIKSINQQKRAI